MRNFTPEQRSSSSKNLYSTSTPQRQRDMRNFQRSSSTNSLYSTSRTYQTQSHKRNFVAQQRSSSTKNLHSTSTPQRQRDMRNFQRSSSTNSLCSTSRTYQTQSHKRNFTAQQRSSSTTSLSSASSSCTAKFNDKPDWMKRLQGGKKKEAPRLSKNIDFDLFPSMNGSSSEITYLDDEDDVAASYFRGCNKMGPSSSTIHTSDLTIVSASNF